MNLKQFLDAAYVLLLNEYQRVGVDLLSAIDRVSEWGAGGSEDKEPVAADARQNDQAMALLTGKLAGVKGSPV